MNSRTALTLAAIVLGLHASSCGANAPQDPTIKRTNTMNSTAKPGLAARGRVIDYDNDDGLGGKGSDSDNDDTPGSKDADGDTDSRPGSRFDRDDKSITRFGRGADAATTRQISALVKRYYAAAASGDGAAGCSMIFVNVAKAIPETEGRPPGPLYLRGGTCAAVMIKLFARYHKQLSSYSLLVKVRSVRLDRATGFALLFARDMPVREVGVRREGRRWKIDGLLDVELP